MRRVHLTAVALLVGLMTMPACCSAATDQLSPAAQTLSQCVQTNHELSVLMLIDESGSLRATDPLNQRVDGIRAALTGLADLADTPVSGRKPEVSVLMAGFYGLVHPDPSKGPVGGDAWRSVDGSSIDALNDEAGEYAGRNTGRATDYATAMLAAHSMLVERAAELTESGGAPPCEALIWFTDGRYSLPQRIGKAGEGLPKTVLYAKELQLDLPGAGEEAVDAGKSLMCKPNGLMDEVAKDGIVRFTVALSTELSPADAAFLAAATTGTAPGQHCGVILSPHTGQYLTAQDGDRLFFAFGDLLGSSAPVHVHPVCPRLSCLRGTTSFTTVPGLSGFLIRASSGVQGALLNLKAPDGDSVRLRPGDPPQLTLSGVTLVQRWVSSRAVEVEAGVTNSGKDWIGPWSYSFIDPSASTGGRSDSFSSVQLYADLEPTILGKPGVIRGVPSKVKLRLASSSGSSPITSGPLLERATITASVSDPVTGKTTSVPVTGPSRDGTFLATISVPNSSSASLVYLDLTARLATPDGTSVAPQFRSYSLPVRLPPGQGFPLISPSELHLPSVQNVATAEGTITVTGSSIGAGCVWVGKPKVEAPDDAGQIQVSTSPAAKSASHCLKVESGESRKLRVRLTPAEKATGTVTASFPVHLRSDVVKGSRVTSVPVSFVLVIPPDTTKRAILLAVLVLLGALLPLAFLYLLNWYGARFTAPQRLLVLAQDAVLSEQGIAIASEPTLSSFSPLARSGSVRDVRSLDIDVLQLRAVAGRSLADLFRGPYGIAKARDGGRLFAGGSSRPLRQWRQGHEHELPLEISGSWIFLPRDSFSRVGSDSSADGGWGSDPWEGGGDALDREGTATVEGRLILVISRSGDTDLGRALLADASQALREADLTEADREEGSSEEAEPKHSSLRARLSGRFNRGGDPRNGQASEDGNDLTEPIAHEAESSEVDPWA
jgi:hypothetical protein